MYLRLYVHEYLYPSSAYGQSVGLPDHQSKRSYTYTLNPYALQENKVIMRMACIWSVKNEHFVLQLICVACLLYKE